MIDDVWRNEKSKALFNIVQFKSIFTANRNFHCEFPFNDIFNNAKNIAFIYYFLLLFFNF